MKRLLICFALVVSTLLQAFGQEIERVDTLREIRVTADTAPPRRQASNA